MKIRIDVARCAGHARCAAVAPDLFVPNIDGYMTVPEFNVPKGLEALAIRAARACPERVISVIDEKESD